MKTSNRIGIYICGTFPFTQLSIINQHIMAWYAQIFERGYSDGIDDQLMEMQSGDA